MCPRGERHGLRRPYPDSTPPGLNHAVVTGKLISEPREGGGPGGAPVVLFEVEFPVAHPEHPRLLWATAAYEVEVPGDIGGGRVEELRRGSQVMVAGQLSERWSLQDGRARRRGTILAGQIQPGQVDERG